MTRKTERGGAKSAIKTKPTVKPKPKKAKGQKAYRFFCDNSKCNPTVNGYRLQNGAIHTEFKRMVGSAKPESPRDVKATAEIVPMTKELAKELLAKLKKKYPKLQCSFEVVSARDLEDEDEDE